MQGYKVMECILAWNIWHTKIELLFLELFQWHVQGSCDTARSIGLELVPAVQVHAVFWKRFQLLSQRNLYGLYLYSVTFVNVSFTNYATTVYKTEVVAQGQLHFARQKDNWDLEAKYSIHTVTLTMSAAYCLLLWPLTISKSTLLPWKITT